MEVGSIREFREIEKVEKSRPAVKAMSKPVTCKMSQQQGGDQVIL